MNAIMTSSVAADELKTLEKPSFWDWDETCNFVSGTSYDVIAGTNNGMILEIRFIAGVVRSRQ